VEELRWCGPAEAFATLAEHFGEPRLLERGLKARERAKSLGRWVTQQREPCRRPRRSRPPGLRACRQSAG
jgi:hypothetical protein